MMRREKANLQIDIQIKKKNQLKIPNTTHKNKPDCKEKGAHTDWTQLFRLTLTTYSCGSSLLIDPKPKQNNKNQNCVHFQFTITIALVICS